MVHNNYNMAIWAKKKILKLSKGFKRRGNCFTIAVRRLMKGLLYQYRDRRVKKRLVRREWILKINNALHEHNVRYSRFICNLNNSNVRLNRKMLADLAVNEPYSFKATTDHIMLNNTIAGAFIVNKAATKTFDEAMQQNFLSHTIPEKEPEAPPLSIFGLRFPERDAGTDADYLRLSFREEDKKWLAEQQKMSLSLKEQKKLPREVLDDNWTEDMEIYKHKEWTK